MNTLNLKKVGVSQEDICYPYERITKCVKRKHKRCYGLKFIGYSDTKTVASSLIEDQELKAPFRKFKNMVFCAK